MDKKQSAQFHFTLLNAKLLCLNEVTRRTGSWCIPNDYMLLLKQIKFTIAVIYGVSHVQSKHPFMVLCFQQYLLKLIIHAMLSRLDEEKNRFPDYNQNDTDQQESDYG